MFPRSGYASQGIQVHLYNFDGVHSPKAMGKKDQMSATKLYGTRREPSVSISFTWDRNKVREGPSAMLWEGGKGGTEGTTKWC